MDPSNHESVNKHGDIIRHFSRFTGIDALLRLVNFDSSFCECVKLGDTRLSRPRLNLCRVGSGRYHEVRTIIIIIVSRCSFYKQRSSMLNEANRQDQRSVQHQNIQNILGLVTSSVFKMIHNC